MSATSENVFEKLFYEICSKRYCMGLDEYKNYINTIGKLMSDEPISTDTIDNWSLALKRNNDKNNECPIDLYTKIKKHEKKIILEDFENDWNDYQLIVKMDEPIMDISGNFNLIFKGGKYFLQEASEKKKGFEINKTETENKYSFSVKKYFESHIEKLT